MPSREIDGRTLRASEILMNPHTDALPWLKPVTAEELMALSSEEEFVIRMWPLTLSEFLTGSPDKWKKVFERELRTPSIDRLLARMAARLILAYRETKDRDALSRVFREAWNELQATQAEAYAMRQGDNYSGTTTIDLTTLTFSGITTSYTPSRQLTQPLVFGGAATQAPAVMDVGAVVARNLTATRAGTGDATAINDATHLVAGAHRTGSLGASGMVEQVGELTATQAGTLTVTVHYTMAHTLSSGGMPPSACGGTDAAPRGSNCVGSALQPHCGHQSRHAQPDAIGHARATALLVGGRVRTGRCGIALSTRKPGRRLDRHRRTIGAADADGVADRAGDGRGR